MFSIHPTTPQSRLIKRAVELLSRGGVIVYPTDTIYGLGCSILDRHAIERVVAIKGRDPKKPLSMICSSISEISEYADISNAAYRIIRHCLPGPYTFVLPASRRVPKLLLTRQKTIGVRVPDHTVPRELVVGLGYPIIGTSANKSDEDTLTDPDDLKAEFGDCVDMILECGVLPVLPSTVVSLVGDRVEILRRGAGDLSYFDQLTQL